VIQFNAEGKNQQMTALKTLKRLATGQINDAIWSEFRDSLPIEIRNDARCLVFGYLLGNVSRKALKEAIASAREILKTHQ
jgi:hypothetical protein